MSEDDLYVDAILLWGEGSQLTMVIEECSELIKAICKYWRNEPNARIVEEAIDVEIMMNQIRVMYNISKEAWERLRIQKLNRLAKLIKLHKEGEITIVS